MGTSKVGLCECCGELPNRPPELLLLVPDANISFCDLCARAHCDGTGPCKISEEEWQLIRPISRADAAWKRSNELERLWLESNDAGCKSSQRLDLPETRRDRENSENIDGDWIKIGSGYWRKEVTTPVGIMISEVLIVESLSGYQSRVRVVATQNPHLKGQDLRRFEALSITEAISDCEEMVNILFDFAAEGPRGYEGSIKAE